MWTLMASTSAAARNYEMMRHTSNMKQACKREVLALQLQTCLHRRQFTLMLHLQSRHLLTQFPGQWLEQHELTRYAQTNMWSSEAGSLEQLGVILLEHDWDMGRMLEPGEPGCAEIVRFRLTSSPSENRGAHYDTSTRLPGPVVQLSRIYQIRSFASIAGIRTCM